MNRYKGHSFFHKKINLLNFYPLFRKQAKATTAKSLYFMYFISFSILKLGWHGLHYHTTLVYVYSKILY